MLLTYYDHVLNCKAIQQDGGKRVGFEKMIFRKMTTISKAVMTRLNR